MGGGGVLDASGQWSLARAAVATDAASMAAQTSLPPWLFAGVQLASAITLAAATFLLPAMG